MYRQDNGYRGGGRFDSDRGRRRSRSPGRDGGGRGNNYGDRGGYGGYGRDSQNTSFGAPRVGGGDKMSGLGAGLKSITWDTSSLPKFEKNFYIASFSNIEPTTFSLA